MTDYASPEEFNLLPPLDMARDCVGRAGTCQDTVLTTVPVGFLRAILPILEAHYERQNQATGGSTEKGNRP